MNFLFTDWQASAITIQTSVACLDQISHINRKPVMNQSVHSVTMLHYLLCFFIMWTMPNPAACPDILVILSIYTIRGVSRRTPGSPGFNVIFSSMVFPPVFLRKNYEKQVILTEKRCWASTLHISWLRPCIISPGLSEKKL